MMSIRRWLISRYDITGLAKQFFKSKTIEILFVVITALLTGFGMIFYIGSRGNISVYDGQGAFLPSSFIHSFDLSLGALLGILLLINASRMWYLTMSPKRGVRIPFWLYLEKFLVLPLHFFTQKRYAECEVKSPKILYMPWIIHLGLMVGYVTMLILVMAFIVELQSGPQIDWWVHVFGYIATIGLVTGTIYFIVNRLKKSYVQYQKSHGTDWVFITLLFLIVLSGILQHVLHRTGLTAAANITYIFHLMVVVPWLLRMPFTKWSHLIYRPMAMYFAAVRRDAVIRQNKGSISFSRIPGISLN